MRQVQFFVGRKARAGKIGGAGDGCDGRKAFKAAATIKEVALGMQEAARV